MRTVLPRGPSVQHTASATVSSPLKSDFLASDEKITLVQSDELLSTMSLILINEREEV